MGKRSILAWCIILLLPGCAYKFQGRHNPLRELGVERIYVEQFRNDTYRPGVEQLFSSAMIREIQKYRSFRLVDSREAADAILRGTVTGVSSDITSQRLVELNPPAPGATAGSGGSQVNSSKSVASEFSAGVSCAVVLEDKHGRQIFSQSVASSKLYPGAVRLGDEGATVPLINDSEQRLAIQFLASQMMASVYQRMIDAF